MMAGGLIDMAIPQDAEIVKLCKECRRVTWTEICPSCAKRPDAEPNLFSAVEQKEKKKKC